MDMLNRALRIILVRDTDFFFFFLPKALLRVNEVNISSLTVEQTCSSTVHGPKSFGSVIQAPVNLLGL